MPIFFPSLSAPYLLTASMPAVCFRLDFKKRQPEQGASADKRNDTLSASGPVLLQWSTTRRLCGHRS